MSNFQKLSELSADNMTAFTAGIAAAPGATARTTTVEPGISLEVLVDTDTLSKPEPDIVFQDDLKRQYPTSYSALKNLYVSTKPYEELKTILEEKVDDTSELEVNHFERLAALIAARTDGKTMVNMKYVKAGNVKRINGFAPKKESKHPKAKYVLRGTFFKLFGDFLKVNRETRDLTSVKYKDKSARDLQQIRSDKYNDMLAGGLRIDLEDINLDKMAQETAVFSVVAA